jgi:hypothetical protein
MPDKAKGTYQPINKDHTTIVKTIGSLDYAACVRAAYP